MSFNDFKKSYFGDELRQNRLNTYSRLGYIPRTEVDDDDYTALVEDVFIAYTNLTAARDLNLPTAASLVEDGPNNKIKTYTVKDESLSAGTYPITITPAMGETIEGNPTYALSNDGECVTFYTAGGTSWFLLQVKI